MLFSAEFMVTVHEHVELRGLIGFILFLSLQHSTWKNKVQINWHPPMGRIINIELAGCQEVTDEAQLLQNGDRCSGHTAFVLCCGDSFYPGFAGCSYCSPRCCQFIPR